MYINPDTSPLCDVLNTVGLNFFFVSGNPHFENHRFVVAIFSHACQKTESDWIRQI